MYTKTKYPRECNNKNNSEMSIFTVYTLRCNLSEVGRNEFDFNRIRFAFPVKRIRLNITRVVVLDCLYFTILLLFFNKCIFVHVLISAWCVNTHTSVFRPNSLFAYLYSAYHNRRTPDARSRRVKSQRRRSRSLACKNDNDNRQCWPIDIVYVLETLIFVENVSVSNSNRVRLKRHNSRSSWFFLFFYLLKLYNLYTISTIS